VGSYSVHWYCAAFMNRPAVMPLSTCAAAHTRNGTGHGQLGCRNLIYFFLSCLHTTWHEPASHSSTHMQCTRHAPTCTYLLSCATSPPVGGHPHAPHPVASTHMHPTSMYPHAPHQQPPTWSTSPSQLLSVLRPKRFSLRCSCCDTSAARSMPCWCTPFLLDLQTQHMKKIHGPGQSAWPRATHSASQQAALWQPRCSMP
jgi:hypothetical protein